MVDEQCVYCGGDGPFHDGLRCDACVEEQDGDE